MFDNNLYNLMEQLTVEHKSLWRLKDIYKKDAEGKEDCTACYDKMIQNKEQNVEELTTLLKKYLA